eukprot:352476-Chlamydomonas_euryale.AAC.4
MMMRILVHSRRWLVAFFQMLRLLQAIAAGTINRSQISQVYMVVPLRMRSAYIRARRAVLPYHAPWYRGKRTRSCDMADAAQQGTAEIGAC